jgi:hypothetical protein
MLTIILIALGYLVISGITYSIIYVMFDDDGMAFLCGLIWPLAIPLVIAMTIMVLFAEILFHKE